MTSFIEATSSILAPHSCIICCNEGNTLCISCLFDVVDDAANRCWVCGVPAQMYETCAHCVGKSYLDGLIVLGDYEESLKELVNRFKYQRAQAVSDDLA